MIENTNKVTLARRFSVAPMMDWTDRHCRYFHRQLTRHALLYTEMVTAAAILHGDKMRLLGFDPAEHPVAVQLGGSDSAELAKAARIAEEFGYLEVNLNVGCPSDRVRSGRFGACLMAEPELVGDCVSAMKRAVSVPVTVKCRLGVDDQDIEAPLDHFARLVRSAGADALIVHARKAWLNGLSPKDNREVPPLDYGRVHRLKASHPDFPIVLNGGLKTIEEALRHLGSADGVMLGRAAYQQPAMLRKVDQLFFGDTVAPPSLTDVVDIMRSYVERHWRAGVPLHHLTRPMLGLFHSVTGARDWRRILTVEAQKPGAGPEILDAALDVIGGFGGREAA